MERISLKYGIGGKVREISTVVKYRPLTPGVEYLALDSSGEKWVDRSTIPEPGLVMVISFNQE